MCLDPKSYCAKSSIYVFGTRPYISEPCPGRSSLAQSQAACASQGACNGTHGRECEVCSLSNPSETARTFEPAFMVSMSREGGNTHGSLFAPRILNGFLHGAHNKSVRFRIDSRKHLVARCRRPERRERHVSHARCLQVHQHRSARLIRAQSWRGLSADDGARDAARAGQRPVPGSRCGVFLLHSCTMFEPFAQSLRSVSAHCRRHPAPPSNSTRGCRRLSHTWSFTHKTHPPCRAQAQKGTAGRTPSSS